MQDLNIDDINQIITNRLRNYRLYSVCGEGFCDKPDNDPDNEKLLKIIEDALEKIKIQPITSPIILDSLSGIYPGTLFDPFIHELVLPAHSVIDFKPLMRTECICTTIENTHEETIKRLLDDNHYTGQKIQAASMYGHVGNINSDLIVDHDNTILDRAKINYSKYLNCKRREENRQKLNEKLKKKGKLRKKKK